MIFVKKSCFLKQLSNGDWLIFQRCKSSSKSIDSQYIQKSKLPTYHFQASLPRLPIPDLKNTCNRYLQAQRPILSESDYTRVGKIVSNFLTSDGAQLQKELVYRDSKNKHTSYISSYWYDMYYSNRTPLPIDMNPGIILVKDAEPYQNQQLVRATNLVVSSLKFLKSLRDEVLEPEVFHLNPKKSDSDFFRSFTGILPSSLSWYGAYLFKAFPLDMSQYKHLFNTTRIPKKGKDVLLQDVSNRNLSVMRNGHFYTFPVLDEAGNALSWTKIYKCLEYILNDTRPPAEYPVGILTTLERNHWADVRDRLLKLGNEKMFNEIDSSIFTFILDNEEPEDLTDLTKHFLHADGCNRWFDKSLSLIVTKNGEAGVNFEHSWGDGVAVLRYVTDILRDSTTNPTVTASTKIDDLEVGSTITFHDFILDDALKTEIQNSKSKFQDKCDNLLVECIKIDNIGRKFAKKVNISPDAIMQLAFQLAHYRTMGHHTATYESCSTSAFKHGRTECIRSCTSETAEFCHALEKNASQSELKALISKCSDVHSELVKNGAMGQGFDRHLFALRMIAEENSKSLEIFTDPSYKNINHFVLSTSTLSSDIIRTGSFGPVVKNGFGIGYMIINEACGAVVTSYKSGGAKGKEFNQSLYEAFDNIYTILK